MTPASHTVPLCVQDAQLAKKMLTSCVLETTQCCGCGYTATNRQDALTLAVPASCGSVQGGMAEFATSSKMEGDNKYRCVVIINADLSLALRCCAWCAVRCVS